MILGKCERPAAVCRFQHRKCFTAAQPAVDKYKLQEKDREAKKKAAVVAAAGPAAKAEPEANAQAKLRLQVGATPPRVSRL